MQNYTCNTLAVVAVVCSTCPLPPAFGEAGESQVQLAPAGTVGIPEAGVYALLFSPTSRVVASEQYRPFLVLAPEESPEEVVEQIRNTKPVASNPYRVRMPEWPESIEFVDEIEAAKAVQRVMQTDRWTDLKEVFYRFRDLKADEDFSSLHVHISFNKSRQADWMNVKIYDSAASDKSLSMVFRGSDRRLSTFTASNGSNEVVIAFYDNGVPFILHSRGDAGIVGWQLRWLPNGEVARAVYLKEPWTPPTETPRNGGTSSSESD